ncbi:NAD(P)/FAD-dependent oxidoreductase [Gracilimonas mengyeensis]|uniref:Sulfide-quinone oxidoreductase n=1 Tax=Gracilimonas mengyeensis TaxID=1302730 RepID=A0A521E847_9BACT|nr:FAD/NAD(P)-binding oxidoreductase [Gracilimonas mengyeensis]SMO80135.1 sulfide-quinone oxidoreductase [Gracilimonas mengyeensis]
MKKRIAIIGSSFAGYTAAVRLAKQLSGNHEIIVIDRKPDFVFLPSFVWYPFGYRNTDDISFDARPIYDELNIRFIKTNVYGFDLEDQLIYTPKKDISYDYLLIATGARPRYESIKGLKPGKNSWSISDLSHAKETRKAWKKFLMNPGSMVIGAAQWAGYFFAAYEFLLNTLYHLDKNHLLDDLTVHFITPEPYLSHFGIGGLGHDPDNCRHLFEMLGVNCHINTEIHQVKPSEVVLENGEHLPSDFTMIIPQFIGVDAVRTTRKLADEHGLIKVTDEFYHPKYPNVYAAGASVSIPQAHETPIGLGVPRTQKMSELMARTAALNIAADIQGGVRHKLTTEELYQQCQFDMDHLSRMIFGEERPGKDTLHLIEKGSQEKWANMTLKRYIEASFTEEYLSTIP